MQNLRKRMLAGLVAAAAGLGLASSASALSLSMEFDGGATSISLSVSDTARVSLFANLDPSGSGQGICPGAASVNFASSLTPLRCIEQGGTFNNGAGGVNWAPVTSGCGPPAGGVDGQNVNSLEQANDSAGTLGGTFGRIKLGSITFHATGAGTDLITPFFIKGVDGFLDQDFTTYTSTAPVFSAVVNIVPEPTTAILLGLGVLGLGISGRRLRGRRSIR
jgi:hypothetical protein